MARLEQEGPSQDLVFDILSNPRRRYVLYHLQENEEPVELGPLSEAIAAWENNVDEDELTSQQRKRVYVSLYQTHIPKMADGGIIEYDSDAGTVRLSEEGRRFQQSLGHTEAEGRSWELYYLALSIVAGLVVLATVFDVGAFRDVAAATVGIAVTLAFGTLTLVHVLYRRYRHRNQSTTPFDIG
jgi:hypothetical protein